MNAKKIERLRKIAVYVGAILISFAAIVILFLPKYITSWWLLACAVIGTLAVVIGISETSSVGDL